MEHTKGPWTVDISRWITADGGVYVARTVDTDHDKPHDRAIGRIVIPDIETAEANARLIAAAPDLLAALKVCQVRIFMLEGSENPAYEQARAAISEAIGPKGAE
jgi:hypothetical protein